MKHSILLPLYLVLILVACEETKKNSTPSIAEIIYSPTTVVSSSSVILNAIATDEDGDELTYNWSSPAGSFSNSGVGNPIDWYVTEVGDFEVTCVVNDGKATAETSVIIQVSQEVGSLSGFIRDYDSDVGLEGARISINSFSTFSQDDGNYIIENIPTGSNQLLTVTLDGYEVYSTTIAIYDYEDTRNIDLRILTGTISGNIYDSTSNQPISSVEVSIEDSRTWSETNGYYILENISLGNRIIWAIRMDYLVQSDSIQVVAGNNSFDMYLTGE